MADHLDEGALRKEEAKGLRPLAVLGDPRRICGHSRNVTHHHDSERYYGKPWKTTCHRDSKDPRCFGPPAKLAGSSRNLPGRARETGQTLVFLGPGFHKEIRTCLTTSRGRKARRVPAHCDRPNPPGAGFSLKVGAFEAVPGRFWTAGPILLPFASAKQPEKAAPARRDKGPGPSNHGSLPSNRAAPSHLGTNCTEPQRPGRPRSNIAGGVSKADSRGRNVPPVWTFAKLMARWQAEGSADKTGDSPPPHESFQAGGGPNTRPGTLYKRASFKGQIGPVPSGPAPWVQANCRPRGGRGPVRHGRPFCPPYVVIWGDGQTHGRVPSSPAFSRAKSATKGPT